MSDIRAGMTQKGLELLAKSQLGKKVIFSKIKIGDGIITNENLSEINDLINVIDTLEIDNSEIINNDNENISLKVSSLVKQASTDYYFRELGLYAIDPDTEEEILYGYVNKGNKATFIPRNTSPVAIQELATMVVAIGNSENVIVNCESELKIIEQIEGNGGYSLFDTVLKDHELNFEESEGFALQGTYVYKNAIMNECWGYPEFYNRCIEEYEQATTTTTVLGNNIVVTHNHANGHIYYDIADKNTIDTFYNTFGVAWFYGIDRENERIFLPRNDYFFKMSSSNVGGYNAPQLPPLAHNHNVDCNTTGSHTHTRGTMNITGTFPAIEGADDCYSGAFYLHTKDVSSKVDDSNGNRDDMAGFSAARTWTGSTSSNGAHSHNITINSANATSDDLLGTTVLPPSTNQLLYIVVGNVRQKSAVVINGELQNAMETINTRKTTALDEINNAKTNATDDITSAKTTAVDNVEDAGVAQIALINSQLAQAQQYSENAQQQAQLAQQYANISVRGQVNSDFNETDPTKPAYIANKPNCDYENITYISERQVLTNKTIDGLNNTLSNISFESIAQSAKNTNISNINNVSDNNFPTSLAVYSAINNISNNNIIGDGEIIDVINNRRTNVAVVSSNPELTVTSSYSGTQSTNGTIIYNFVYTLDGWVDEAHNLINISDYDLTVTGTPVVDDVITLQYTTSSSSKITATVAQVAQTGSYNDLTEQPIYDGLSTSNILQTTVTVATDNDNLTVTSSYTGTQSEVGEISYTFVYSTNGWIDDEENIVTLSDYDLTVTGTPVVDDVISLTYKTISRIKITASHQDISGKEDKEKAITALATSGTIALSDNSIYKITPTGAVTFSLPTISNTNVFHQILVQINLTSVVSISTGTTRYFNKTAPDLSETGVYDLIYEYDNANGYWVCGAITKGAE